MLKKTLTLGLILFLSTSVFSQKWKTYPYTPSGSLISFPVDEGRHSDEPVEWWYTSGHIIGKTTGKHYSYMLSFFCFPTGPIDGFRILNISDDDNGVFYDDMQLLNYSTLATDKLDIQANKFDGGVDSWKNKNDGISILPYEYVLKASSPNVMLDLEYKTNKHPLILGENGYLKVAYNNYTYYYSQTGNTVKGTITYNNVTENVTGTSWIERQYGNLNPTDGTEYEWISIQLSNNMDINLWNIFTAEDKVPDDKRFKILAVYVNDDKQYTISDFEIERLEYAYTPDNTKCYAQKWRLISSLNSIDLIITTLFTDSEVNSPIRFYEGVTKITGTVNGRSVTGKGFAELLHSYDKPAITITNSTAWNKKTPLKWELNNPDDGNPLQYDLAYSIDNQKSFLPIVSGLTATSYIWNTNVFSNGNKLWLKLSGNSIDGTLTSTVIKELNYDATIGKTEN